MHCIEQCDIALDDFCAIFWPCSFVSKKGEQCVNVKERHAKGRQSRRGTVIGTSSYESSFTFNIFADNWFLHLKTYFRKFQFELESQITL
jgi:hypothetical protein